jgi:hypothetical protein
MEVTYSSVPETDKSLKNLLILSLSAMLIVVTIWYLNKKINKKYENSNLH